MKPTLNNHYTNDELTRLRDTGKKKARPCLWCQILKEMRSDQKFCSNICRMSFHAAARRVNFVDIEYELSTRDNEIIILRELIERATKDQNWAEERKELIYEIAVLKKNYAILCEQFAELQRRD